MNRFDLRAILFWDMSSSQTKQDRTLIQRIELIHADFVKRISENQLNLFDLRAILFWYKSSSQTKQDVTLIQRIDLIFADFVKQISENQ
ncbi:MAG: hypothetical protein R2825_15830 [Saprospiraceae bacterium]